MRLIDADALLDFLDVGHLRPPTEICFSELMMKNIIELMPTVDAVPVRHGKWKLIRMENDGNGFYMCSNCERGDIHFPSASVPYCWYCGARMDEE